MTAQEKREAIALACGWRQLSSDDKIYNGLWVAPHGGTGVGVARSFFNRSSAPPDYLNSLDAMALAEATLSEEEKAGYIAALYDLGGPKPMYWRLVHAPAADRADAFLAVKGLLP